jgi:hypothetical protein
VSTIAAIADAVAAHINSGTYSRPVAAERMYQPAFTLEDLKDLRVSAVPRTVGISAASRDSSTFECVIDVGVQQKLPAEAEEDEIDALLDLVEEIADRLRLTRLPGAPEAAWAGIAHEPVVSSEALEQHRVFTSVLSVTYRVRR